MTRRLIGLLVTFALGFLSMPLAAVVPERGKVPRVGVLCPMTCTGPSLETFRQALHELGYVEGQTIALEYQAAEGREERLPALAVDLVRRHVDVIFTVWGTAAALAAK